MDKELKRILVGTIPPPPGGDATWAVEYLSYYKGIGIDVPLVNTSIIGKRANTVDEKRNLFDELRRSLRIWKNLKKVIEDNKPHIAHLNINCSPLGTFRDLISGWILKKRDIPFVLHCHCNIEDQIANHAIAKRVLVKLFDLADGIITINSKSFRYTKTLTDTRIKCIPNFVPKMQIDGIERVISDTIRTVVFSGHIRKTKGIGEIIEVSKSFPDIRFLLIGPITEDYPQYTEGSIIGNNTVLLGCLSHEEVIKTLKEADVFIFPSYTEGFSISLVEAMSVGLPCIASDVGANKDMLEEKGGIIVPPHDYLSIISALNLLEEAELRNNMSLWNMEKVKQSYSIDRIVNLIEEFYKEVLNEKSK